METASKDVLFTIALDSELPDLLRWCMSSKKIYQKICGNDDVWRAKLLKDYPEYQELDLSFLSPPSLKEKYIFMYQLDYIKELLNTLETLKDIFLRKDLNLTNKNLKKIPFFNLPDLQVLYLNNNQLTEVPSFNFPNLQYLDLNNNQLTEVPSFNLPNLQYLYLQNNQLTEIPSFNLPNLRELSLSGNQLTEVPSFNLPNLKYLFLKRNQLTKIPRFDIPKIQYIFLDDNQLTEESKEELKKKYGNKVSF